MIGKRELLVHGGLFAATCASCVVTGGAVFAATLMSILLAHEMGHYLVARWHRVDVSLPYFIPLPFLSLGGTLGAVIHMRAPITRRDALIDVGAAGPLAGLVLAIPLLVLGLADSTVAASPPAGDGSFQEGNSLLYMGLKYLVHGRLLPDGGVDVQMSEMATAAWMGVLLTFINLIPVGQLDGGHVAFAFFGERQERHARLLHAAMALLGLGVLGGMTMLAMEHGRQLGDALAYGALTAMPWMVWTLLLAGLRRGGGDGRYHPAVEDEPLSPSRRRLFWLMLAVFVLVFTPVPLREIL